MNSSDPPPREWWRDAVVYEVYPISFADGNGDGLGDLPGLAERLEHIVDLGVDAIWLTPWFPSPMVDGGYDVSDYRGIHPSLGTLSHAEAVIAQCHASGLRVIIDMVANHTSDQHPWFRAALNSGPGSAARSRYLFADGRGRGGDQPPTNWISAFGGSAWTRITESDGRPGQWYLHTFAPEQPDLNWRSEHVGRLFDDVLRFWFDKGIDGIRVDAAPGFIKEEGLADFAYPKQQAFLPATWVDNPHWDVDGVHDVMRRWRAVGDSYAEPRYFVVEAGVNGSHRLARYLRPDEMHAAFNFPFLHAPWDDSRLRDVIDDTLAALAPVRASATWVLSSHDEVRRVTRFAQEIANEGGGSGTANELDVAAGTKRARAAALLLLALPGSAYLYQGEELGLPQVSDLPDEYIRDPAWARSGFTVPPRDGCRVPMPWSGDQPPFGFTRNSVGGWLPQPPEWRNLTVAAQQEDPHSMLHLHKRALRLRRELAGLRSDTLTWRESDPNTLDFQRPGLRCVVNLSSHTVALPSLPVLLTSQPLVGGRLPPDAAAWLAADSSPAQS